MATPLFLALDEVLEIHRDQIEGYGGILGVRDIGLLQSALAMPAAMFEGRYLHHDLYEMAAAYLFHIARNHPFADGNKRVGTVAAIVFLAMNNIELDADETALEEIVLATARGSVDKPALAEFFRLNSRVQG